MRSAASCTSPPPHPPLGPSRNPEVCPDLNGTSNLLVGGTTLNPMSHTGWTSYQIFISAFYVW